MKQIGLLVVLSFLTTQHFYAQNVLQGTSSIKDNDILFGAKVGATLAQVKGDGLLSGDVLPGFQIGGAVEIPVWEELYLAPELLFSLQGTRGDGDDLRLGYVNIPLMGKYHVSDAIAVEFGPQLGVLLTDNGDDFNFDINDLDFGLGIGGGYRMDDHLYFQLRFNLGFSKVVEGTEATNRVAQLGVVYYFY